MPRERLPKTRYGKTHKGIIYEEGTKNKINLYITVNCYEDGRPAELFVGSDQYGGTRDGFSDAWATAVSLYWQNGGTVDTFVRHFAWQNFSPFGWTDNPQIRQAKSIVDYVARWVDGEFGAGKMIKGEKKE